MAQTPEQKLAKQMAEALDNHWFNPSLFADILTTDYPIYTQNQVMEVIKYVVRFQAKRMRYEWENDTTSDNLLLADALAEIINTIQPDIDTRQYVDSLPEAAGPRVNTSWIHSTKENTNNFNMY